jgi:glyoxylase-like metal-dependent hydrolase (beta-lactamase superfamily II)
MSCYLVASKQWSPVAACSPISSGKDIATYLFGDLEVTLINTDHRQVASVMGAANAGADEREAVRDAFGPLMVDTVVTLVDTGEQMVLIDCGSSSFLPLKLQEAGFNPDDVDLVVMTHLHADHAGGAMNALDGTPLFPNARYVLSREEHAFWMRDEIEDVSELAQPFISMYQAQARSFIEHAGQLLQLVEWDDEIFPGARMIPAVGHTGGHSAVEVISGGKTLLHVGDLIVHPALHLAHPDWHLLVSVWPEEDLASRRMLMDRAAAEHLLVQTVHFPFPGVGYVEKHGDAWRWIPLGDTGIPIVTA